MYSSRLFQLLILVVAILCVAQASWPDNHALRGVARRQVDGDTNTDETGAPTSNENEPTSAAETSEPATTTDPADTTSVPTSDPADDVTTTSDIETTSSVPESTSAPTTRTSSTRTTRTSAPSESTTSVEEEEQDDQTTSEPSRVVSTSTVVYTRTNEDGETEMSTSVTRITTTPGLNSDDSDEPSGMSEGTRNTVIGVVVGVGGAILLGALAIVWWRLRGRKKQAEENDGLMAYDNTYGNTVEVKPERGTSPSAASSQRSPFQSTLENYHQPTPVNPSSNF